VWGSGFTSKSAKPHRDSKELLPSSCIVGLNPVAARARIYRVAHFKRPRLYCSHRPRHLRSLFRCETPVFERSSSGYITAPSRLVFTKPARLRAAARFAVNTPLAVKPRRRRAWRSHGRHRVRKLSSRVAVASLPLLGAAARIIAGRSHGHHRAQQRSSRVAVLFLLPVASLRLLSAAAAIRASLAAAAIRAWRSHGRHRVWQRSNRVGVLFLLAVASLHRVHHRSSRVAVNSLRLLGAAAAIYLFAVSFFPYFLPYVPKFEAGR